MAYFEFKMEFTELCLVIYQTLCVCVCVCLDLSLEVRER